MSGSNEKRPMKVYGWQGHRYECPASPNGSRQTREIVAAPSVAAVMRLTGLTRSEWQHSGCETGNQDELDLARSKPGTIFWAPLDSRLGTKIEDWTEASK